MSFVRSARRPLALLGVLALAACDATAPTIDQIDTQAAAAAVAPVMAVMTEPALASFTSLTDVSGLPEATTAAASLSAVTRVTTSAVRGTWDRSAPLFVRNAARAADVLPPEVHGNTYVYNASTGSYEVAANRNDAPAAGIRVVLYAWDALSGAPSSPLTQIGYVDLIDESTDVTNRLNVVLVRTAGNATLMDYDITHTVTTSSESFSIAGTATNGLTPVEFNLTGMVGETTSSLSFDLEAPSVGFNVHAGVSVNAFTQEATIETALGYDGHTLSFVVSVHENGMNGEIKFDGLRYATLTVTVEETPGSVTTTTTFLKANGRPMTIDEIEAISALFEDALEFDAFWVGLLWPLGALAPAV